MRPHIVQITIAVDVLAPSAPAAGAAVMDALRRSLEAKPSTLFVGARFQLLAIEKPAKDG